MKLKRFLFTYPYKGAYYDLEIPAETLEEAKERVKAIRYAHYDGELKFSIRSPRFIGDTIEIIRRLWIGK